MLDTSRRGVEVLRILALSIRSDQDYRLTSMDTAPVGAFRARATQADVLSAIRGYHPPYQHLDGYTPLGLRQALSKIAHANPTRSGFFADEKTHDLILSGLYHGDTWLAVISLIDLCGIIKSLPDVEC
jgi:hypothetical protein